MPIMRRLTYCMSDQFGLQVCICWRLNMLYVVQMVGFSFKIKIKKIVQRFL